MQVPVYIPERRELKYVIDETTASAIRRAITPYCRVDPHSAERADRQYGVTSLYFDTPSLAFHRAKVEREPRRVKARVRIYDSPGAPVFFEVKRKSGVYISKLRAAVPPGEWRERLAAPTTANERGFRVVIDGFGAVPTLLARYRREAYESTLDRYARVTFDRAITFQACRTLDLEGDPRAWMAGDDPVSLGGSERLVLELKCEHAVPRWMVHLIRAMDLQRRGYSKYSTGVRRLTTRPEPFARVPVMG